MTLDLETFLWFVLPVLFGLFLLIAALLNWIRNKTIANWTLAIFIWTAIFFSGKILYNMFFEGGYPTYLPHLIIGGSIILLLFQSTKKTINK
jgi:hypothetical protein